MVVVQEVLQRRWEPRRWEQWMAVRSWQWPTERIIKADPLKTTREVAQELNIHHSTVVQHLKQIRKVRKLSEWVPHEWTANQKIVILKCRLLLLYTTTNHFSIRLWCAMKSRFYMTTSNDHLSGWTKNKLQSTSKSQNCTKKSSWLPFGVCCLSEPIQLSEFRQNQYIWEVCSANGWDAPKTARPAASTGQQKGLNPSQECPTAHHKTNTSKAEWAGLRSFASSAIFTWPLAKRLWLLQASWQFFAGKMLPQSVGGRKWFPRFHRIPRQGFLCYRNKQTSLGKNVLIVMVPILINKDVLEPSYNDLKFTVWNCNYVCTNRRIDAFELWCWRRLLRVPWTARRSTVHSKGDQPWMLFGRNDAKAETPVLWPPHEKSWLIGKRL